MTFGKWTILPLLIHIAIWFFNAKYKYILSDSNAKNIIKQNGVKLSKRVGVSYGFLEIYDKHYDFEFCIYSF